MEKHWRGVICILTILWLIFLYYDVTQLNHTGRPKPKPISPHCKHQENEKLANITNKCNNFDNLKKVLLLINYNFPHYATIPVLKKLYSGLFADIVFCGDSDHPEVIKIDGTKGYLGYACVAKAIRLFPDLSGYLYINDDVILNWWNIIGLDTSKIWTGKEIDFRTGHKFGESTLPSWHWWHVLNTAYLCEVALEQTLKLCQSTEGKRLNLTNLHRTYYRNTNGSKICLKARSDVVYIPQEYAEAYAKISDINSSNNVFLEVAVPGILAFFWTPFNSYNLNGSYFNDIYGYSTKYYSGEAFYETYTFDLTFSHPFKLGGQRKAANWNFLKNVVMQYGKNLKQFCLREKTYVKHLDRSECKSVSK